MSDEIISALISSCGAVICCLIGIKIGKENSLKGMSKEVLQQQLDMVYSPIIRNWHQNPMQEIEDRLAFIQKIFFDNFDLVMPSLFRQMMDLKRSHNISVKYFADFQRAINSNYNWNKKLLGYPYDNSEIQSEYLPTYGRVQMIITFIGVLVNALGAIALFIAAIPLYDKTTYESIKDSSYPYFAIIAFYFLVYVTAKMVRKYRLSKEKRKQKNNPSQK